MKRLFTITVFITFFILFAAFFAFPKIKAKYKRYKLKKTLNIAKLKEPVVRDLPFVVVVPSYNNEQYCEKNLESIFSQEYSNYRVIYINDASTDRTKEITKKYLKDRMLEDKVSFISNSENKGALYNLYTAIHSCRNDEIVVLLDGDDWFAHDLVLKHLNQFYNTKKVWMTYGNFLYYPSYTPGESQPTNLKTLKDGKLRDRPWITSHLRTFYAGLFKKIKEEDLQKNGEFYPTTYDLAIMFPMLEMAREHVFFIPEVLYIYNFNNPINDGKVHRNEQMFFEKYIRSLPKYNKLKSHPSYP